MVDLFDGFMARAADGRALVEVMACFPVASVLGPDAASQRRVGIARSRRRPALLPGELVSRDGRAGRGRAATLLLLALLFLERVELGENQAADGVFDGLQELRVVDGRCLGSARADRLLVIGSVAPRKGG